MKYRMIFTALAALTAPALANPPASDFTVGTTNIRLSEPKSLFTCLDNRLLPDPSSQRLVLWRSSRDLRGAILPTFPSGISVLDLPPEDRRTDAPARIMTARATARLEPLRWNKAGDRLLLRVREDDAALYDPVSREVTTAPQFDPMWQNIRIEALSHGPTDFYRAAQTMETLRTIHRDGEPVRGAAAVGGASTSFLIFRLGNRFRLTAYDGQRRWETGLPLSFATAPLLPPGARRPLFMGDQKGHASFLPYALPVLDRSTGQVMGRFGWERIELSGGRTIDLAPRFRQLMRILDVSANGETIFALVDLEREKRIVRVRGEEVRSWHYCEKKPEQFGSRTFPAMDSLPADIPVTRTEIRFSPDTTGTKPGHFGYLYRPAKPDGRLVIYFHGGPTATLADQTVPLSVSQLFAPHGISFLAVEYSGMLGGGLPLSERLPRLGHGALREDVAAVTRWVERSGFRQAFVLADSFGGAPAVIAAVDHPRAYEHIFLRAPFLALRKPEQTVRRNNLFGGEVPPERQREFEEAVYGGPAGREKFGADLHAYVQRLRPSARLSFYFGRQDPVSAVTDLPPAFAGHPSVMIENSSHGALAASWKALRDVLSKIKPGAEPVGLRGFPMPKPEKPQ